MILDNRDERGTDFPVALLALAQGFTKCPISTTVKIGQAGQ